jgi:hypothetical protein
VGTVRSAQRPIGPVGRLAACCYERSKAVRLGNSAVPGSQGSRPCVPRVSIFQTGHASSILVTRSHARSP